MNTRKQRNMWIKAISVLAAVFGVVTVIASGTILSGNEAAQTAAGNYVPFIVWFNFVAGIAYLVAAAALWKQQRSSVWLSMCIAVTTAGMLAVLGLYVESGATYELRTVIAMAMRLTVWGGISVIAWRYIMPFASSRNHDYHQHT